MTVRLHSTHELLKAARRLRRQQTYAEGVLWVALKASGLHRLKFRRQHPIGLYIVDFYCAEKKLVVELEGEIHAQPDQMKHDKERFEYLESRGLKILRISNDELLSGVGKALRKICKFATTETVPPHAKTPVHPSPETGGGTEGEGPEE